MGILSRHCEVERACLLRKSPGKSMNEEERRMGKVERQIITKGGKVFCDTVVLYPPEIVKTMKKAGYRVREVDADGKTVRND